MLSVDKLSVAYNNIKVLGPIDLDLTTGEICAIIGPSGCGKSTLIHALSGIIKDFQGNVNLDGEMINPKLQSIGFIPQGFGLLPWKRVKENCGLALKIKNIAIDLKQKERIENILNKLNIADLMERYPKDLSGGQKQRVAIARAFIMNPSLLLMDEPFSALDAITREEAKQLFMEIWREYKTTTILVTHSIEEAIYMGKKILVMSHCPGNIIEVIENPLFEKTHISGKEEYHALAEHIRIIIQKGWSL